MHVPEFVNWIPWSFNYWVAFVVDGDFVGGEERGASVVTKLPDGNERIVGECRNNVSVTGFDWECRVKLKVRGMTGVDY